MTFDRFLLASSFTIYLLIRNNLSNDNVEFIGEHLQTQFNDLHT